MQFTITPSDPSVINKSLAAIAAQVSDLRPFFRGRLDTYVKQTFKKIFMTEGAYVNGRRWAKKRKSTIDIYNSTEPQYAIGKIGSRKGAMEAALVGKTGNTRIQMSKQTFGRGAEIMKNGENYVDLFAKGRKITSVYRQDVTPNRQVARPFTPKVMPSWWMQGVQNRLDAYLTIKIKT